MADSRAQRKGESLAREKISAQAAYIRQSSNLTVVPHCPVPRLRKFKRPPENLT